MNDLSKLNLVDSNIESVVLFENEDLIVLEQEGIKWIVTKDNEILMTVKDIGLLGGNEDKTKRYERDLRNKEFIVPYSLNDEKCKYEHLIKKALVGREDGNMPIVYSFNAITQIIAELRTDKARKRNKQLGILQDKLRKGELQLNNIDMKNVFNNIALKPTTPYRQKRNEHLLSNGLLDVHVETRCYNVKLTSELSEMVEKLGFGNYLRIINRKFAEAIYPNGINEFDLVNGVTNPHNRRDYCDFDQLTITQYMSAKLVEKLVKHQGKITLNVLMDYVDDCVMIGLGLSDIMIDTGGISITINTMQSSLEDYYTK